MFEEEAKEALDLFEKLGEKFLHTETIPFGKHRNTRWVNIPAGYLSWLANESKLWSPIVQAELARRGTSIQYTVDIRGHAIDRASQRLWKLWLNTRKSKDEGLHSWLQRMFDEAVPSLKGSKPDVFVDRHIKFYVKWGSFIQL